MRLQQCDDCQKFRRHVHTDKWGKVCMSCLAEEDLAFIRPDIYEFRYKFLLMELEQLAK